MSNRARERERAPRAAAQEPFKGEAVVGGLESIWKDKFELKYVARAVTAGAFHAPGSHVERMYQPQLNARAESVNVLVLPKE